MNSMTGFGRAEGYDSSTGINFIIEISTVNRKQLEIRTNLPREIASYEPQIRAITSEYLKRGSINIRVELLKSAASINKTIVVNEKVAAAYSRKAKRLQEELELGGEIDINNILNLPGVIDTKPIDFEMEETQTLFTSTLRGALKATAEMRATEGAALKNDLVSRVDTLEKLVETIAPLAAQIPVKQKEKLLQRLSDSGLEIDPADERVMKEIVIFSDKSDVTEEVTRLASHFNQFRDIVNKTGDAIGRSLDFMVQEIHREITTFGNKASGTITSASVVEFKTELEKIREQIQNVE